jgi:hypothetical protein
MNAPRHKSHIEGEPNKIQVLELSDTLKVQDIEAAKGTKVHGYLKRVRLKVKSPIDGVIHTRYPARLVFPGDNLYILLKMDEATGW